MARVLISDKLNDEGLRVLADARELDLEFDHKPDLGPDALRAVLPDSSSAAARRSPPT